MDDAQRVTPIRSRCSGGRNGPAAARPTAAHRRHVNSAGDGAESEVHLTCVRPSWSTPITMRSHSWDIS